MPARPHSGITVTAASVPWPNWPSPVSSSIVAAAPPTTRLGRPNATARVAYRYEAALIHARDSW